MELTKDKIRYELEAFLSDIDKEKKDGGKKWDIKQLLSYLVATGKFECTFRDLFTYYLQKKYRKEYLVLPEYSIGSKSVDICFLKRGGSNKSSPVLIIEIKHYCSFDSGKFKTYVEEYLDNRLGLVVPNCTAIKMGIVVINHIDVSLEMLEKYKQYKYFVSYLRRKKKIDSRDKNLNDIKEEIKSTNYYLLEKSIKGVFEFNKVDKVNTELFVLASR